MPPRQRNSVQAVVADRELEEAKSFCRRFKLRVSDARQVSKLLAYIQALDARIVHENGRIETCPVAVADEMVIGIKRYECEWTGDLLFAGDVAPEAGGKNAFAQGLLTYLDPSADKPNWRGPVLIRQYSRTDGLPEALSDGNSTRIWQFREEARGHRAALATSGCLLPPGLAGLDAR